MDKTRKKLVFTKRGGDEKIIREIKRRCDYGENGGGPYSITSSVADMLINEDGERKYLTCCWVDEVPDAITFEVSTKELYSF